MNCYTQVVLCTHIVSPVRSHTSRASWLDLRKGMNKSHGIDFIRVITHFYFPVVIEHQAEFFILPSMNWPSSHNIFLPIVSTRDILTNNHARRHLDTMTASCGCCTLNCYTQVDFCIRKFSSVSSHISRAVWLDLRKSMNKSHIKWGAKKSN